MAKGLVTHAYLEDTADAIRGLRGESDTYTPAEMGAAIIDAIPTEEVTDDIVSITDAAAYPAEELEFAIEPVQDLHGYDKPWPAGGGKNELAFTLENAKALNTEGAWNDNVYTINGVTFTYILDSDGNAIGIKVNGTASAEIYFKIDRYVLAADGVSHLLTGTTVNKIPDTLALGYQGYGAVNTAGGSISIARATGQEAWSNWVYILVGENYTVNNVMFYPMIRLASDTEPTFKPYSNVCPISGWTGVNGERTGKNLVFKTITQVNINSEGKIYTSFYSLAVGRVKAGITYTATTDDMSGMVYGFFENEPKIGSISYDNQRVVDSSKTFTAPIDGYVVFRMEYGYATPQLELGSTATAYEPYQGTSIPITFPALGVNQWDEETVLGRYNVTTGELNTTFTYMASKNYIPVNGNTTYYFYIGINSARTICYYDENKRFISGVENVDYSNTTFTTPNNAKYLRFSLGSAYGTTYNHDISINYPATDTTYHSYNNTVYGGKAKPILGKLVKVYTNATLTYTDSWLKGGTQTSQGFNRYYLLQETMKSGTAMWGYCDKMPVGDYSSSISCIAFGFNNNNSINVLSKEADVTAFKAWLQDIGGLNVVYELATPIEYDMTPQQVELLLGNNNVWCDTGDTTLEYKVDLERYIEKLQTNQTTPQLSLSRQAVSLDAARDETTQNEDEAISEEKEDKAEDERMTVEETKALPEDNEEKGGESD